MLRLFRFSRHNVLHLWPYVITDLKNLGAKAFYGKFATGQIEHISTCAFVRPSVRNARDDALASLQAFDSYNVFC